MNAYVAAGAGFLLAVLWMDLMFDIQVAGRRERELPEQVLASIAAYYARVTTRARPMNRLIALVMAATLAAIVVQIADGQPPAWVGWAALGLAVPSIVLAVARIVGRAVRLGARIDTPGLQSELARSIFREHVLCAAGIAAVLVLELVFG